MSAPSIVFVVGHRPPDADSAVSAVMTARLLRGTRPGPDYQPVLAAPPNPQTLWLFEQAGEALPPVREDARPTAGEACRPALTLNLSSPLGAALDSMRTHGFSLIPVVDDDGRLAGAVGHSLPNSHYLSHFNLEDFFGTLVGIPELARGLDLEPANPAAEQALHSSPSATPPGGVFRIFPAHTPEPGDAVLAAGSAAAVKTAAGAGAAVVVLAECGSAEARGWGSVGGAPPVFHFRGSLMALISQLPRAIPAGKILFSDIPVARSRDVLEDLREVFARTPHALPVLDENERVIGMVSRREALAPPRPGLVLVDHFEVSQAIRGWDKAVILEILDHHRIGTLETAEPARVDCRPLGSTATIVALRMEEAGLEPSPSEALLLLGAILSDTLLLRSPTTTDEDRRLASGLARKAAVGLEEFGRRLLASGDALATDSPETLAARDLKEFSRGATRFLLGQIETTNLQILNESQADALRRALENLRRREKADFALLMVTDVLAGTSRILAADTSPRRLHHLLEGPEPPTGLPKQMVSRKKELLPWVLARLAAFQE